MLTATKDGAENKNSLVLAIEKLTSSLDLPDYDVLLIGDGSGTVAQKCSAWACWYCKPNETPVLHTGTFSLGTNNFAELIPYVSVLWLDAYQKPATPRTVVIVSDSELTVRQGTGEYSKNTSQILWDWIDRMRSIGYHIIWKHVKRNTNPFSAICDREAGNLRREIEKFQLTNGQASGKILIE